MQQETSYPDPAQLREYAKEPMPFYGFTASDLDLNSDNFLVTRVENVEFRYRPADIHVETEEGDLFLSPTLGTI